MSKGIKLQQWMKLSRCLSQHCEIKLIYLKEYYVLVLIIVSISGINHQGFIRQFLKKEQHAGTSINSSKSISVKVFKILIPKD